MSLQGKVIALVLLVCIVLAGAFSLFQYGRHVEGLERDNEALKERLVYAEAFEKAQTDNDKLKTDGARQHAQDTAINDRVRDDFDAYRLRVPKAKNCDGVSNPTSGSVDRGAGGGGGADKTQAAFDRFTGGLKQDGYRLDTMMDSCRAVMNWARNLCKLNDTCKDN